MAEYENTFVREVKERSMTDASEILNWYRNLYHTEDNHTEQGIVAYAINDLFMEYKDVVPKSEVERLEKEVDRLSQVVLYYDAFKADEIKDARQEVAMGIFEEIEKCMAHDYISTIGVYNGALELRITELKKKYI